MKYMVMLHLSPTRVELPVKIRGEEAERVQSGFNVEYHVYQNDNGAFIKEGEVKEVLEVEVRGIIRINPSTMIKGLVLTAFVEKGELKLKDKLLVIE